MSNTLKQGIIFAFITAGISGISIFYNKLIIVKGIDPTIFNIIKNGGAAILLSLLLIQQKKHVLSKLTKKQWMKLLAIGIIGGGIPFILFFEGLKSVSAINANLIHKSMFLWIAALAIPFLGERLTPIQIVGYIVVAFSNLFIGGFTGFGKNIGELMILTATLFWAVENIIAKIALKDLDAEIVGWGRMTIGTVFIILFASFTNKLGLITHINSFQMLPILGSIVLLTGYVFFWFKALKLAPATTVSSILVVAAPITNILTALFITHAFSGIQIQNLIGTAIGVSLIAFVFQHFSKRKLQMAHTK